MSDVVIVPFENKHAEQILEQGLNSEFLELKPEHKKYAFFLKEVGMSFTGLVNNRPIAAGGVFHLWDGVAEGWVLATKDIYKYPVFCAKHIKQRTEIILKANKKDIRNAKSKKLKDYKIKRLELNKTKIAGIIIGITVEL